MTGFKKLLFLPLLFINFNLCAEISGNMDHQEIGDVVFRNLDFKFGTLTEDHSAIYVGQTNKTGVPSEPFSHEVIQMAGIQPWGISGLTVTKVKGIGFDNLGDFQRSHPKYYGAFMYKDNPSIVTRKDILRKAQELMTRPKDIDYIVKKNEPGVLLLSNYFEYNENGGKIELEDISRMRSDAFVEYCYAAAEKPIMAHDITTETGANALIGLASYGITHPIMHLFPSDQLNSNVLKPSVIDTPTIAVSETLTGQTVLSLTGETDLKFSMTDLKSGPGLLEIKRIQGGYFADDTMKFPFELKSDKSIFVNDISITKEKRLTEKDGIIAGSSYEGYVYDQAGNKSSMFSFTISGNPLISINSNNPLYEDFKGVSVSVPSTIEREHGFEFKDEIAGISNVEIKGPDGSIWTRTFDPPVQSTYTSLGNMELGQYTVKTKNSTGNETIALFRIDDLKISISTENSSQNYVYHDLLEPGTFHFKINVMAESSYGFEKAQLISSTGALLSEKLIGGFEDSIDFDVPEIALEKAFGGECTRPGYKICPDTTGDYYIRVFDKSGNSEELRFQLNVWSHLLLWGDEVQWRYTQSINYKSPIHDLISGDFPFLFGALTSNYEIAPSPEVSIVLNQGGGWVNWVPIFEWDTLNPPQNTTLDNPQTIGTLKTIINTWGKTDKSDMESYVMCNYELGASSPIFSYNLPIHGFFTKDISAEAVLVSLKKYVQQEFIFTKTNDITLTGCSFDSSKGMYHCTTSAPGVSIHKYARLDGFVLWQNPAFQFQDVASGDNISVDISSNVNIVFDNVATGGNISQTLTSGRSPSGYNTLPNGTVFDINSDIEFNNAVLTFAYDSSGLTSLQENKIKLVKVRDPATGKYEELESSVNTTNKIVSANITSFSKFMVLVPEYANLQELESVNTVDGLPEMEFVSNEAITQEQYDMSTVEGQSLLQFLKSRDQLPITNVYKLGPDNLEFSQSGVIKIRYSDAVLSSLGVDESTLGIYQFTADGSTIMKLPYNTVNTDANEITARVPKLTSLFAILVSSQQAENIPPSIYPDGISPVTTIGFIGITYPASDGTFISDKSSISFTATDPQVPNVETSDISIINYFVDPDTSIEISTYTGPFILNEGIHQIHYLSMDTAENYEFPKSATVYIDALEPETDLEITGSSFTEAGVVYININSSISLHAYDPPGLSNVMAGIKGTYFLIDITMDQCVGTPTFAGPHGTCDNPIYSEPFMLRVGTHTISFFSEDNVGNIENHKLVEVSVGDLPDITAPITELDFTHESYQSSEGQLYTNVISSIELTAYDPQIENQTNSGFATTYYLVDVDTTTVQPLMYSEPFSLTEGSHTVYYASVDNAENFEEGKTTIVYADGTAPITSLRVSEFESSGVGETVYMVETDSISITVIDPVVNGVASDVNAIYFLVDTTIDQCLSEPTLNGPAGTCENPVYSEPFILSAGTHTIYYMSADNVDNKEEAKTVNIVVESSFSFDFSGTAQSPTSISWVWNLKEDATAYQVISSSGGAISSILDGSATYYIQTNLIPNTRYSNFLKAYSSIVSESAISETITFANVPMSVESFASGQSASVVIGQQDFYSNYWESGPSGLASPRGVALDKIGNLWVVDSSNYRVLRFSPPFTNGMSANLVLGQSSLYLSLDPPSRWPSSLEYPESLVFDAEGNLWVSDPGNNRIVRFSPPFTNGMDANLVLGAPSFYTYFPGAVTAKNFSGMYINLAIDSTENLWVSDSSNHRVLRFSPPFTNGMDANLVIGQADFNSSGTAYSPPVSDKLCVPGGISFDGEDNLWVTDVFNDRVLKFEKPFTNGEDATLVIGQPDFYTNYFGESYTGTTQDRLHVPVALNFDALNNLYVMDHRNKRIVGFKPPFSNGMNANLVIGQPDFTTNIGDTTPENFKGFFMGDIEMSGFVITDFQGRMWVSDVRNNRVLLFESGKAQAFSEIDSSSFTVRWDGNFNSEETLYQVEISKDLDFNEGLILSGYIPVLQHTFVGIEGSSKYYVRVKAKNNLGTETDYAFLGSVVTKPNPPTDLVGVVKSSNTIIWTWNHAGFANYQAFNADGEAISEIIAEENKYFVQTNLLPNATYTCFVRATNASGEADSEIISQITFAALPRIPELFLNGQDADFVIGQSDFISSSGVRDEKTVSNVWGMAQDADNNLWVADTTNCRILKFEPPFINGMKASIVIGQRDFVSMSCDAKKDTLNYPTAIVFDNENRMWISDAGNNRVLMFNPPFTSGMSAGLVIGQLDFNSKTNGNTPDKLSMPRGLHFGKDGNLWVADSNNHRLLRFSPPFTNGMNSNLRIGGYSRPPTQNSLTPRDVKIDASGNIWAADLTGGRVLKFEPPFTNNMNASLVIGQPNFNSEMCWGGGANRICYPEKIELDKRGNLYITDARNHRVLIFKPPFTNGMNASIVLGQETFYVLGKLVSRNRLSDPYGVTAYNDLIIWISDNGHRVLGFNANPFVDKSTTSFTVKWHDSSNPPETEYKVEISQDISFTPVMTDSSWIIASSYTFAGLLADATYYARLKVRNDAKVETDWLNLGHTTTFPERRIFSTSEINIDDNPEIYFISEVDSSIVYLNTASPVGTVVLATATKQGLTLASNLYEIGPEGIYEPPASLTFSYSTTTLADLGLLKEDISVYEYFTGIGWVKLDNQVSDFNNNRITVPISQIASIFGIFGVVKDRTEPITTLEVAGDRYQAIDGKIYTNTKSSITLMAYDPIVYGTSTGVAFAEFKINPDTSTLFGLYDSAFMLDEGINSIEFRSHDNTGNIEVVKSTEIYVDSTAPVMNLGVEELWSYRVGELVYINAKSSIALTAIDPISKEVASGIKETYYSLNDSTSVIKSSTVVLAEFNQINNIFSFYAEDNVNNRSLENTYTIIYDTVAPITTAEISGERIEDSEWYSSSATITLVSTDTLSGIKTRGYKMERSSGIGTGDSELEWILISSGVYSEPIQISSEGIFNVYYWAEDRVGNIEEKKSISLKMDLTKPEIMAISTPTANSLDWNNTSVDIVFVGADSVSGIEYCSSSFTVSSEGFNMSFSGYCADYAGWISTVSFTVNIDTNAPMSSVDIMGVAGQNDWHVSAIDISLISTDSLSGLASSYYSLDGSEFTLYTSSFSVGTEGEHLLKHYSVDVAGNTEEEKSIAFKIDVSTPEVSVKAIPEANEDGWNNVAINIVFSGTDSVSGIDYCSADDLIETEGSNQTIEGYCIDFAGNSSSATYVLNIDTTLPVTEIALSGEMGANDWYVSATTITLTFTDTLSGIKETYYRIEKLEGEEFLFLSSGIYSVSLIIENEGIYKTYYQSKDKAGNIETEKPIEFKIDLTKPEIGFALNPVPNSNNWNSEAVSVMFSGTDSVSGIEACSGTLVETEGRNQLIGGWCRDVAGNTAYSTVTLNIDFDNPLVSAEQEPLANINGWNNTSVNVVFKGTDVVSGIEYCTPDQLVETEGSSQTISGYCMDYAGWSSTATLSVSIDTTLPNISYAQIPLANAYGWNNGDVRIEFSCSDDLSGIKTCPQDILFADEGVDISTTTQTEDKADNIAVAEVSGINIDKTIPVSTVSLSGMYRNDWYSSSVEVILNSTDTLSGIKEIYYSIDSSSFVPYVSSFVEMSEGNHIVKYYAEDNAGNIEPKKTIEFKIDKILPEVGFVLNPVPNSNNWNNEFVKVTFSGTDTVSGIEYCTPDQLIETEGKNQLVNGWCRDVAGNIAYSTVTLNIDFSKPLVSAEQEPLANINGWNNTSVNVVFSGTDSISGINYCTPNQLIETEGSSQTIKGYCLDFAGNSSTSTIVLNIDKTIPEILISSPMGNQVFIATRKTINIFFDVTDNLDSAPQAQAILRQIEDLGSLIGTRPMEIIVSNGQTIEPLDIDDGKWKLMVSATDFADNTKTDESGIFEVVHDVMPPQSELRVEELGSYRVEELAYITGKTSFTLTSIDDLIEVNDDIGLGVKQQNIEFRIENIEYWKKIFENGNIVQGEIFTSTFTLTSILTSTCNFADGLYDLVYNAEDILENIEEDKVFKIAVDNTAPISELISSGDYYENVGKEYAPKSFTYAISSNDPMVNGAASGIKFSEYRIDGGEFKTYDTVFDLTEGIRLVGYRSYDNLSNIEILKSKTILVDNTAPVTSFSISEPLYMKDGIRYITPSGELSFTAQDPIASEVASGVNHIETSIDGGQYTLYTQALKFSEGRHSIKYRSIDNVGNAESEKIIEVQSDNTPPITTAEITGIKYQVTDGKLYINAGSSIVLSAIDPLVNNVASGVEGIYYGEDSGPENKYSSAFGLNEGIRNLNFKAKDNVGNSEVVKSTTMYVDGTAPNSILSLSGDQYREGRQYISDRTDIIITAEDSVVNNVAVGIKETKYAINGSLFNDYSSFKLNTEGKRIVSFYSIDHVNNNEDIKTSELWVDMTKPITELTISGVSYSMAGDNKIYITKNSGIVLESVDPISSSTASGILLTKYRIDGGNWQLYSGSFTITSEGLHAVDYYAIDKVQNIEGITTQSIIVDNTAPISSISLGEPKFEAFGLPVITPNTLITIAAHDPIVNEMGSGLKEIYYSIASPESPNPNPVFYTEPFTITEQGTFIVRYWTKDNVDNIEQSKEIKLAVMTLQQSVLIAVNELDMNGNSDIAGKVQSNGKVDITGSARIFGDVEAGEIKIKGHGEITGQQITNALPVNSEPIDLNEIAQIARELEEATTSQFAEYITDGKLSLKANTNLVITTGTYYFRGIDLIGGSSITISGNADIFVEGDISISGGSSLTADKASDLNIFMSSDTTINMSSKADLLSYLYAPKTTLNITGNVRLGGHYFVRDANLTGNSNVIQSGEELPELEIKSKDKKKFVSSFLAQTTDTFGIAGVSSEFTLREIYVFPNPSLGGQKPTFHIEVGIADSVKITIYTVSGRFAHNHIMTGMPITLDDGNGLDYAYEYTWSDNIPSGVYYYFIEAKKSGRTLKKTGKFAVVR